MRFPASSLIWVLSASAALAAPLVADAPKTCAQCQTWSEPREPFRVFGNTWYVGNNLGSILITSPKGHILIDGGLTQSPPLIAANIAKLGFKLEDVKLILNSHTHFDHAGGIAAIVRVSHARVAASPAAKRALERGGPTEDDPQFTFGDTYPKVARVNAITDGQTLHVGPLAITAHFTPGHTPGGTTWTWRSCEGATCYDMVYADSLNSISAPGFRFTGDATHPSRVATFEQSIATVAGLPCDILLAPHPELVDLYGRLANHAFVDRTACRRYADAAGQRLEKRIAEEQATP